MSPKFFRYKGYLPSGRKVSGIVVAFSEEEAKKLLERKKIFIKSLKESNYLIKYLPLSFKELEFFFGTLSRLLESSISIDRAVGYMIDDQPSPRLAVFLYKLKLFLEEGLAFSEALEKTKEVPKEVVEMVKVGEISGKLVSIFHKLSLYYKEKAEIKKKLLSAFAYPSFVFLMSLGVISASPYLLKQVRKLYQGLPVKFPVFSEVVFQVSTALLYFLPFFFLFSVLGVFFLRKEYKKSKRVKMIVDKLFLSIPAISSLLTVSNLYRSFLSILILYSAGISLQKALQMVKEASSLEPLKNSWELVIKELEKGSSFSTALSQNPYVSQLIISLLSFAEKGGFFEKQLMEVVKFLKEKFDSQVNFVMGILTPALLFLVAIVVFVVLLATYLPMFDLINGMAKF